MTVVGRRDKAAIAASPVGSLSQTLMARSHNPVVVVAPDADLAAQPVGRVVVALGDRPASLRALEFGIEQARRYAVELCVLHAWRVPELPPGHRPSNDAESAAVRAVLIVRCAVATVGVAVPAAEFQAVLAAHPAGERPLASGVIAY